jgi:Amt family ammonium transporter
MDTGSTAWMLTSTALVMIMLPGLALFYGGLVRRKNVLSTIMHSFFGLAIVSVVWVLVGFSLAFGPDANLGGVQGLIGNLDYVGFSTSASRRVLRTRRTSRSSSSPRSS